MAVSSNFDTVSCDSIVYELKTPVEHQNGVPDSATHLVIIGDKLIETLLDDVIAVEIFDEHNDMETERDDDGVDLDIVFEVSLLSPAVSDKRASDCDSTYLSARRQKVDHLLNRSGTVHVKRDVDEVLSNRLADHIPLVVRGILQ